MPSDLTKLREAWERAQALSVDKSELIPYIGVYGGNLTTTQADDLARRAYDQAVADRIAVLQQIKPLFSDYYERGFLDARKVAIARLGVLRPGSRGEKGGE